MPLDRRDDSMKYSKKQLTKYHLKLW